MEKEVESPLEQESKLDFHTIHRHRLDFIMLAFGVIVVVVFLLIIALQIPVSGKAEVWLSAILALGLASVSVGLAGAISVEFKQSGLVAQGTLGFGVFILVFIVSTFVNCRC